MRAIACAAVLALAACGSHETGHSVAISGGTAEQRALLSSIADGLAPKRLQRIAMRNIGVVGFPEKTWVELSVDPPLEKGWVSLRARWEGFVLGGVFRDRSAEAGLPDVRYFGGSDVRSGPPGSVPSPEPASPAERIAIARTLAESASEQRASVEQLDVLAPAGPAVALVLRVDDPASFVKSRFMPMIQRWVDNGRLEGAYVLVQDTAGAMVLELALSTRVPIFWHDIRPDLAGCDPVIPIGDPHAKPPPPCPA